MFKIDEDTFDYNYRVTKLPTFYLIVLRNIIQKLEIDRTIKHAKIIKSNQIKTVKFKMDQLVFWY